MGGWKAVGSGHAGEGQCAQCAAPFAEARTGLVAVHGTQHRTGPSRQEAGARAPVPTATQSWGPRPRGPGLPLSAGPIPTRTTL